MALRLQRLRPLLRAAVAGVRTRGEPPRRLPPRRELVAECDGLVAEPRRLKRYLAATEGGRIPQFAGGAMLPPVFPVVWTAPLLWELLARLDSFPLRGMIHLESDLFSLRPLDAAGQARCRVEVERLEASARGLRLDVLTRSWDAPGRLCIEERAAFLLRYRDPPARQEEDRSSARNDAAEAATAETEGASRQWAEVARWRLRADHGRRYARAAGDYNPIHLSALTARLFGYRRAILQGYCTQALIAHALIEHLLGGEPERLRRLRIAFRRPLLLPAEPLLQVEQGAATLPAFEVVAADRLVYASGEFTGG
jgi:hypothetical protein